LFAFIIEHPVEAYAQQRYMTCMQNSKRLRELGIIPSSIYPNNSGRTKNKPHRTNNEDSGSEYDPSHEDASEEEFIGDDSAKVLIPPSFQGLTCLLQDLILFYPWHSRRYLRRRPAKEGTHKVHMTLLQFNFSLARGFWQRNHQLIGRQGRRKA
jgi:hypothetical protein